jgi:hypothetical protein
MCFSDLEEDLDLAVRTIREAEDDGSATVIIVSTLLHIPQKSNNYYNNVNVVEDNNYCIM